MSFLHICLFSRLKNTISYSTDLTAARQSLSAMGAQISAKGIPGSSVKSTTRKMPAYDHAAALIAGSPQSCIVFAFTGAGNVTKGAREMFELLPHEYITPKDLPGLRDRVRSGEKSSRKVYGVLVSLNELVRLKSDSAVSPTTKPGGGAGVGMDVCVDKTHYYANPDQYESIFHTAIAPYVSVVVNGIYWDNRYPRVLTKAQLRSLRDTGNVNLKVIADITCDVGGSFEFLSHTTSIEKPFFTYNSETDEDIEGADKKGVLMLGAQQCTTCLV
jgi:alpha-aminoadipic semialdehyde synthase